MTVGGVTSIVGFALTFMNKESLDKLFNKDVKELTDVADSVIDVASDVATDVASDAVTDM